MEPANTPSASPTARSAASSHQSPIPHSRHRRRLSVANTEAALRKEDTQVGSVASAIESGDSLDLDQIQAFERIIKWEIDELSEELKGKSTTPAGAYPKNLTVKNWAEYIVFPTLVYELEYPRQDSINWFYVAEKTLATFGSLGVMVVVSQAFIYPVVMHTVQMREEGLTLAERLHEFPWVLSDLLFPFMMEYLLTW
jgi:sterol O-acyltransferase